ADMIAQLVLAEFSPPEPCFQFRAALFRGPGRLPEAFLLGRQPARQPFDRREGRGDLRPDGLPDVFLAEFGGVGGVRDLGAQPGDGSGPAPVEVLKALVKALRPAPAVLVQPVDALPPFLRRPPRRVPFPRPALRPGRRLNRRRRPGPAASARAP